MQERWNAEVIVLSLIAPSPQHRWPLSGRTEIDVYHFSGDDTNIIARCLCVAHTHGRDICAKLVCLELEHASLFNKNNRNDYASGSVWGYESVAALFTLSAQLDDELAEISRAVARMQSLPRLDAA